MGIFDDRDKPGAAGDQWDGQKQMEILARETAKKWEFQERINTAVELAIDFGGTDGDHHKAWVIDQMVRALTADDYDRVVTDAKAGEDGPDTYDWDEGIAP